MKKHFIKFKFLFLIFLFFAVFGLVKNTWAATITASSCSLTDVQAAVNSASNGDTVNVPAGACTWSTKLMIQEKAIKLYGAGRSEGSSGTRITFTDTNGYGYTTDAGNICGINWESTGLNDVGGLGNIVFRITNASANKDTALEVANFVFYQGATTEKIGGIIIINGDINNPLNKVRIHDNLFRFRTDSGASLWSPVISAIGYVYGVFHSNEIYTTKPYIYVSVNNLDDGNPSNGCTWGLGKHMWYNKTYQSGTPNTFFFEDNIWHYYISSEVHLGGITHGGSMVLRYNSYYMHDQYATGMGGHDLHGPYKGRTSTHGIESYGNFYKSDSLCSIGNTLEQCKITSGTYSWYQAYSPKLLHLRGGRNMAFFNLFQNATGDSFRPAISLVRECDECLDVFNAGGAAVCNSGLCAGKLRCAADQQPPFISDTYFFKNFYGTNGNLTLDSSNIGTRTGCNDQLANCGTTTTVPMPQQNVYWWLDNPNCTASSCLVGGIGCGRTMPTGSCQAGSAYWKTDQSCSALIASQAGAEPLPENKIKSGTLYRCSSENKWTVYYTPYTYPHPLRGGIANTAPAVPTGVRVI